MKKINKIILSVLLFTFSFVILHDYIISHEQSSMTHEVTYKSYDNITLDTSSELHESIQNLLFQSIFLVESVDLEFLYLQEVEIDNFFISQIPSVLQRPPLS